MNNNYPSSLGLQGGSFVNAGVIPRVNMTGTKKEASPPSRASLERDLGLGTSGEDESSESSLSKNKGARAGGSKSGSKVNSKEIFHNEGYWSDDEEGIHHSRSITTNPKPGPGGQRGNKRQGHSSSSAGHRSLPREPLEERSRKNSRTTSYINESKFP